MDKGKNLLAAMRRMGITPEDLYHWQKVNLSEVGKAEVFESFGDVSIVSDEQHFNGYQDVRSIVFHFMEQNTYVMVTVKWRHGDYIPEFSKRFVRVYPHEITKTIFKTTKA